jgi:hypothetical protein
LLAYAAERRRAFAAEQMGRELTVLFEDPADDGRTWVGHAQNHVLVGAAAPDGRPLANEIARVRVAGPAGDGDRVRGTLLEGRDGE